MNLHHEVALLTEALSKKCTAEFPLDSWMVVARCTPSYLSRDGVEVRLEVHSLLRHQTRTWVFTRDKTPKVDVEDVISQIQIQLHGEKK